MSNNQKIKTLKKIGLILTLTNMAISATVMILKMKDSNSKQIAEKTKK